MELDMKDFVDAESVRGAQTVWSALSGLQDSVDDKDFFSWAVSTDRCRMRNSSASSHNSLDSEIFIHTDTKWEENMSACMDKDIPRMSSRNSSGYSSVASPKNGFGHSQIPVSCKELDSLVKSFDMISVQSDTESFGKRKQRYKTEICRSWRESGTCKYAGKCQFAHGDEELKPLPRHPRYKTQHCKTYHTTGFCPYGPRCHFVHDESPEMALLLRLEASRNIAARNHRSTPVSCGLNRLNCDTSQRIPHQNDNSSSPFSSYAAKKGANVNFSPSSDVRFCSNFVSPSFNCYYPARARIEYSQAENGVPTYVPIYGGPERSLQMAVC